MQQATKSAVCRFILATASVLAFGSQPAFARKADEYRSDDGGPPPSSGTGSVATPSCSGSTPIAANVCVWVVEKVFVPPTYQDIVSCDTSFWTCVADPTCCIPVACNVDPFCQIVEAVETAAAHWEDKAFWKCDLSCVDPKAEFYKWARGQVPSLDDLLLPFAFDVAKADIAIMKTQARDIPQHVKGHLKYLVSKLQAKGTPPAFTDAHVSSAKIISNNQANASLYLREGFAAITLFDLIIIRDERFGALTDSQYASYSNDDLLPPRNPDDKYVEALLLLAHELVHVKQYAALGYDTFLTNYLLEVIATEYGDDSFEREADAYEFALARLFKGPQLVEYAFAFTVAQSFGMSRAEFNADKSRWLGIADWMRSCVSGKEKVSHQVIPLQRCPKVAIARFSLPSRKRPTGSRMVPSGLYAKTASGKNMLLWPKAGPRN